MSSEGRDDRFAEAGHAGLVALRRADAHKRASDSVEARLLLAFDTDGSRVRTDWRRWSAIAAVLTLAVGGAIGWVVAHGPARSGHYARVADEARMLREVAVGEFVAWPGAAVLPDFEGGELVRTTLPATALPLLGIPLSDAPATGQVVADVLYGQDGQPRAVRVVGLRP